jgi:protein involved in polysaccharide export with SLBB domain
VNDDAAAAPVKLQEAASTTETATPTTAAPASVAKQTPSSEATGSANADSAAAHNVTDSNSQGASPANTNLSPASASPAPASANPASPTVKDETTTATTEAAAAVSSSELPLTSVYRIGVGDVLDIRLLNSQTSRSTLFTVMNGGLIEYPLVGGSFAVAGLTTDELGARLAAELKRRSINVDSPVVVSVRDYTSHTAIISGLVNYPGKRILRREATPLYVIIAEAQLRPDASRAVIVRNGAEPIQIDDLTNPLALNVLIKSDDFITISARQLQYYFIGGRINSPGQKAHQPGLTLIQAILAAGGRSRSQDTVEISREETGGRLTTTKYVLKEIKAGKIPDPRIQPGDRIEVGH